MALWMALGFVLVSQASTMAEGLPSRSKLSKLGLSSMQVASDDAGSAVRGKMFGAASITFTLTATDNSIIPNTSTVTGTLSYSHGQAPRPLGATTFGGGGFGGFNDNTNPNFSTFTSTPLTTDTTVTGNAFVSSIQGFMFSIGR
jgi:hypothetical protein